MTVLFSPFYLAAQEITEIPTIFHWIRFDDAPVLKEEMQRIRSWQNLHPGWRFKLWTNGYCSFKKIEVCKIDSSFQNLEEIKKVILQQEGGVYIDLDLIGCKSLKQLIAKNEPFQAADGYAIVGCAKNQFDSARKSLPEDFIFPNQMFVPNFSSSSFHGACFWKFEKFDSLNARMQKIHSSLIESEFLQKKLCSKLFKVKLGVFVLVFLALINALLIFRRLDLFLFPIIIIGVFGLILFCLFSLNLFTFEKPKRADKIDFISLTNIYEYENKLSKVDKKSVLEYQALFHNFSFKAELPLEEKIPKTIHFIWGGAPFPEKSIANILTWIKFHPDWSFNFWTDDADRKVPVEGLQKRLFNEILEDSPITPYYEDAKNWGEKSDLLRYEILLREGGLYVDHDVVCKSSFEAFHDAASFYAPAEPLHKSPLFNSYLTVTNCLIGARSNHPILAKALNLSLQRWEEASQVFPSSDQLSVLLRTLYRTFYSFDEASREIIGSCKQAVILPHSLVFPSNLRESSINRLKLAGYPLASHQWCNSWFKELEEVLYPNVPESLSKEVSTLYEFCRKFLFFLIGTYLLLVTIFFSKTKGTILCSRAYSFFFVR